MRNFRLREHDRVSHLREVSIHVREHGPTGVGHLIDLSHAGVRLFTGLSLSIGDMIRMTWGDGVTLDGTVANVRIDPDGLLAGVQFHQPLSPEAFRELREHRVAKGPAKP